MAKAISDEELQLKKRARRRLVGAIALVLLVVVFLPMFLDSEPKPLNQDIAITIPPVPPPETAASTPTSPAPIAGMPNALPPPPETPAAKPVEPVRPEPPGVSASKADLPAAEIKPPIPEAAPKPAPKLESRPVTSASGDGYVVQLGAFSNSANARALQKKLQENKFKAYTELIKSPGGDRTRVRVGPYTSREAADKARDQLKSRKLVIGDATVVRQGD
jgi:DedD protein